MTDENNCQTQKNCQIKSSHRNNNLNKIKILECEFCEETFGERNYRNDKKYREHLKIHMKPQKSYEKSNKSDKEKNLPICEVCDHRSKANISTHFKTVHKITKKLKKDIECYICYLETTSIEGKFFFLTDLFPYLAVFHPSGIFQHGMAISSKGPGAKNDTSENPGCFNQILSFESRKWSPVATF